MDQRKKSRAIPAPALAHAVLDHGLGQGLVHRVGDMDLVVPEILVHRDAALGEGTVERWGALIADAAVSDRCQQKRKSVFSCSSRVRSEGWTGLDWTYRS